MTDQLKMFGITGKQKPNASNCPIMFSQAAKTEWVELLKQEYAQHVISSFDSAVAWELIIKMLFDTVTGNGDELLDSKYTSRATENTLSSDVTSRRSLMVQAVDKTKVLQYCKLTNIAREVIPSSGTMTLKATADISLSGMEQNEWLQMLATQRFINRTGKWRLFGVSPGTEVGFDVSNMGIKFVSELTVKSNYIPPSTTTPLVDMEKFEKYIINKVWLPVVREFRYTTIRRKTSLL